MMNIVKKNILTIICGIILLLAFAAAFYPLGGYNEELQGKLAARGQVASQIEGMTSKTRTLPIVSPDSTESQPLGQFPTEAVNKKGEEITKQVAAESLRMRDAAVKMNTRQLLLPGSLPDAQPGVRIQFREVYRVTMPLPTPASQAPPAPGTTTPPPQLPPLAQELHAGVLAPTWEITRKQDEESKKIVDEYGNVPGNKAAVDAKIAQRRGEIPDEIHTAVAKACMIYADSTAFDVNANITAGAEAPNPVDIFLAQMSYWLQKDVVAAINETNATPIATTNPAVLAPPKNVMEAPVKRLYKIAITPQFVTGAAPGQPAAAPPIDPDAPLVKMTTAFPTGRVSNGLFDVMHFTMLVDVEAEKLPLFLQTLGKNRFLNAMIIEFKTLDSAKVQAEGYRYGSKPVVQLNMTCEALFFRKWTTPYMPAFVKQKLGLQPPAAGAPAQ